MITVAERLALSQMTELQIRRAQDLVNAQIKSAHAHANTAALEKLREWEDEYTHEMLRRLSVR